MLKDEKLLNATRVTGHTLVGYMAKEFPIGGNGGNCFSVELEGGDNIRIVNFGLENLEELIKRGLTWPVKVVRLSKNHGVICDGRIGDRWYPHRFCSTCCPSEFIPIPQRLDELRQMERGERTERLVDGEAGKFMVVSVGIGPNHRKEPLLP